MHFACVSVRFAKKTKQNAGCTAEEHIFFERNNSFRDEKDFSATNDQHPRIGVFPPPLISAPVEPRRDIFCHLNSPKITLSLGVFNKTPPNYVGGHIRNLVLIDTGDEYPAVLYMFDNACLNCPAYLEDYGKFYQHPCYQYPVPPVYPLTYLNRFHLAHPDAQTVLGLTLLGLL